MMQIATRRCDECGEECARETNDGSQIVYCGACGKEWHPGDDGYPTEYVNTVRTADGRWLRVGARAYSHYTMSAGTIGEPGQGWDGWFDFTHDDGSKSLLNGERICTLEHAQRMSWPNAS